MLRPDPFGAALVAAVFALFFPAMFFFEALFADFARFFDGEGAGVRSIAGKAALGLSPLLCSVFESFREVIGIATRPIMG